ncbi:MAG: peptidylprolyl isomerase [Bacteroidetes bacterium]|nr:peptidylprolyl isomerase [Bacteroidota bacterium]
MKHLVLQPIIFTFFICFVYIQLPAQTLFTYGDRSVSKQEFLKAFQKNNTNTKATQKSYNEYLELYTRYKLKVKAAYDLKIDTMPNQLAEMQNFRNQIVDQYMNNETSVNRLVEEAFVRSQKDIHLAHIFIALPKNPLIGDTLVAYKMAMDAYNALKSGKNFGDVAVEYSQDPFAKENHGDIGFITVFTLPYDLENLAYKTAPGKFSKVYRGKSGYHIFKNIEERKAIGKINTAQILLMVPANADENLKSEAKKRADSIYDALQKGSNFAELARKFSGDNLSYQLGGEMSEFGVGKYESNFEKAAFALKKDGDISQPVLTSFGYHIIKRTHRNPVAVTKDKKTIDNIKQRMMNDQRIEVAHKEMLGTILKECNFKSFPVNEDHLFAYTDSSLQNKKSPAFTDINSKTILFSFSKKEITVKDWIEYRTGIRNQPGLILGKSNKEILAQYQQTAAFDYYRNHLEDYNKEFAYQLNEFKDGNLLFEIMQHTIWDKASADSAGLRNYFEAHKNKYFWEPSADAIIFTCANEKAATDIQSKLPSQLGAWKKMIDSSRGMAQADSGRFERTQLPPAESGNLKAGQFSSVVKNTDNSVTMAYIITLYNDRTQRSYNDARGLVINDYQVFMEDNWIATLKKKYPVKVNDAVLKSLPH